MIYLIHCDSPYHRARHYVGYCEDGKLAQRGLSPRRARLTSDARCRARRHRVVVALSLLGDRSLERQLKHARQRGASVRSV